MNLELQKKSFPRKKYKAFGLKISSEIILSELLEDEFAEADITIKRGKVPDTFDNITIRTKNKMIGKNNFILDNVGIAKYFVKDGNEIILELYDGALFEEVKLYLLGSCMGAILYQRGVLPLHGSCININGQGILITGDSGAGKSTIGRAILNNGYKMVTDDVAAISLNDDNKPIVYPSYPSQKLWEDAIERIEDNLKIKSLNRISNELNKYSVENHDLFCKNPIELKIICEIIPSSVNKVEIKEVKGINKLNIIIKNTYRRFMVKGFGCREWHFKNCTAIANEVSVYKIERPEGAHLEKEIAERIIDLIKGGEFYG